MAQDLGFVKPILVGGQRKINTIMDQLEMDGCMVIHNPDSASASAQAVSIVKSGEAQVLVKGMVNTSVYMKAILNRENGLRTGRLISLTAVYEMPCYHKLIFGTDSGINTAPNLEQKVDILNNALLAMSGMGIHNPKVALLAANEMVQPKDPGNRGCGGAGSKWRRREYFRRRLLKGLYPLTLPLTTCSRPQRDDEQSLGRSGFALVPKH